MDIIISNADKRPIYVQIYSQIRDYIVSGRCTPGELLPSIRSLAKELRISVITTKRAYEELEKEGFIHTVAGKGCFVSEKNNDFIREMNLRQIEEYFEKILALAHTCGICSEEIKKMLDIAISD